MSISAINFGNNTVAQTTQNNRPKAQIPYKKIMYQTNRFQQHIRNYLNYRHFNQGFLVVQFGLEQVLQSKESLVQCSKV